MEVTNRTQGRFAPAAMDQQVQMCSKQVTSGTSVSGPFTAMTKRWDRQLGVN